MQKRWLSLALCALIMSAFFSGCKSDTTVYVQSVGMITGLGSVGMYDKYAGVVEAGETVDVEKGSDMELDEVLVSVGDIVHRGDVLFTYSTEALNLDLEKQQLELEQLNNTITTKNAQIADLEKEKKSADKNSQLDYTLQIQSLQLEVKEDQINVTAKEKEISRTQAALSNAQVTSEVEGTIKTINTGDAVDPNTGMALPFITITQSGEYRVKALVNEQNMDALAQGQPVIIRSRVDDMNWTGTVTTIDYEHPEQNSNDYMFSSGDDTTVSNNYPVYIAPDTTTGLMLGQHVYVEPDLGQQEQDGFYLPANFIVDADLSPYVWAANDEDELEIRPLVLGAYDEELNSYEVLDGLSLGDYIASPDKHCTEGAAVSYYDESSFGDDTEEPTDEENPDEENPEGEYPDGDLSEDDLDALPPDGEETLPDDAFTEDEGAIAVVPMIPEASGAVG